ncbi:MAG TPA: MerR family transcriptional regulator, partial [Longimicrobiales bacterium]|nr:MerR family transcriptional regulator [Longimicrobiales bacterium]
MSPPPEPPRTDGIPPQLKVGALARMTGLTVRALHHYEAVGLLAPAGRTRAGHRVYGTAEVRRLHQITSLRQLGLSLDEIARVLDDPAQTLEATLDR